MIQPKMPRSGLRSGENGWNSSCLTGNKTKTLCVDQQIPYGDRLLQLSDVQIDTRGVQTALLAFFASSSTLIRRSVCILPGSLPPPITTARAQSAIDGEEGVFI